MVGKYISISPIFTPYFSLLDISSNDTGGSVDKHNQEGTHTFCSHHPFTCPILVPGARFTTEPTSASPGHAHNKHTAIAKVIDVEYNHLTFDHFL